MSEWEHDPGDGLLDRPAAAEHTRWGHGALRAGVFGMSDGLVSTAALVMGVAGGAADPRVVLLAGVAGLLAGASSMAVGEWISVQSQAEALGRQLDMERAHLRQYPQDERAHMMQILQGAGLSESTALQVARELEHDLEANLEFHAKVELGFDPREMGSPGVAAGASFVAFMAGGALPVLPWVFLEGGAALGATIAASTVGLFALGAATSRFTTRSWWWSGLRQLLVGAVAAALTWTIGRWIGGPSV